MKTEIQEKLIEIASRVKGKGDTWEVKNVTETQKSLTDALEAFYQSTNTKPTAFRLDLAQGKLFAIFPEEVTIEEPQPKKYNIYGEYE
jgi:P2-related tail formation protein